MSTQAEDVIEEGVEDPDDNLIDSLIDVVHFNDLVLEKDVVDIIDQIEAFCTYYVKHAAKAKFKTLRKACELQIFELCCVCAWESVSISFKNKLFLLTLTTFLRIIVASIFIGF